MPRRPPEYYVDELPETVRVEVLEKYRDWNITDEWWDFVYEDAKRMGALMGITIDEIRFSGFSSQGDGASFNGRYNYDPEAVENIKAECCDPVLITIATGFTQLQVTVKLLYGITYFASVGFTSDMYCHSATMRTTFNENDFPENQDIDELVQIDIKVEALLQQFADWIYDQLSAESEYLESDEAIIESLNSNGLKFNLDGERIERRSNIDRKKKARA